MADKPAGFSSPMGGQAGTRAWEAVNKELKAAGALAKTFRADMEGAAKAAERTSAAGMGSKGGRRTVPATASLLGMGAPAASRNGGAASMPALPGALRPRMADDDPSDSIQRKMQGASMPRGNGGGAAMPPSPGMPQNPYGGNGGTPQNPYGGTTQSEFGAPKNPVQNGGGANIGGLLARGAKFAGAAIGAGVLKDLSNVDSFRNADYLANRAARTTNGGYNKEAAGQRLVADFGNSFRNDSERMQAAMPIIQRGGFVGGSAGYNTLTQGARTTAALNPMLAGQAGNIATGFQSPELFNNMRASLGVETIGRGGAPKTPAQIAQEMVRSMGGGAKPMSLASTQAELGATGSLRFQMKNANMTEDMQQSIGDYLTETAGRSSYMSESKIQKRNTAGTDNLYGAEQETATAKMKVLTAGLTEFVDGFEVANKAVIKGLEGLATALETIPGLPAGIFGPAGAAAAASNAGATGGAVAGVAGVAALAGGKKMLTRGVARSAALRAGGMGAAGAAGIAALPAAGVMAGLGGLYYGAKGVLNADTSEGRFSGKAWSSAWDAGLGGALPSWLGGSKGRESGDGLGTRPSYGSAGWSGISQPEYGDSDSGGSSGGGGGRGGSTVKYLTDLIKGSGLKHRITSTVRGNARTSSGNLSYHATGNALDISGPTPGNDTDDMLKINKYLAQKLGAGAQELIYSGPGGVNLHGGKPHAYSNTVRKMHHNHVHVAVTDASLKRIGQKAPGGAANSGQAEENEIRREKTTAKVIREEGKNSSGRRLFGQRGRFSEARLIRDALSGLTASRGRMAPDAADMSEASVDPTSPAAATATGAVGSVGANAIDKFLYGLRDKESNGDYSAENGGTRGAVGGDSSASGAYQYLDSTWNKYKGYKYAAAAPAVVQDERARMDASRLYGKYGNWKSVAAAHFAGEGWLAKNSDPSKWGVNPVPGSKNPKVNDYVKDVLERGGLPESGDGIGGGSHGVATSALGTDPSMPRSPGGGSGGGVNIHGGSNVRIAKVEVHLHDTGKVSQAEASRIAKMVVTEIAQELRMKEMSR